MNSQSSINPLLFVRVASVNGKGSILSDFHIINRTIADAHLISPIERFQCLFDDQNQKLLIQWSIDYGSRFYTDHYLLYYQDVTRKDDDLIRRITIPLDQLSTLHEQSQDLYRYQLNRTTLDLDYEQQHRLQLHLSIIDQHQNQLSMTSNPIYCTLTRKYGKNKCKSIAMTIDRSFNTKDRIKDKSKRMINFRPITVDLVCDNQKRILSC